MCIKKLKVNFYFIRHNIIYISLDVDQFLISMSVSSNKLYSVQSSHYHYLSLCHIKCHQHPFNECLVKKKYQSNKLIFTLVKYHPISVQIWTEVIHFCCLITNAIKSFGISSIYHTIYPTFPSVHVLCKILLHPILLQARSPEPATQAVHCSFSTFVVQTIQ